MPENVNGMPGFADGGSDACPDGGTCHHACGHACFRVRTSGPLSGVYPGDRWPFEVRAADVEPEPQTAGAYVPRPHELRARAIAGSIALGMPDAQAEAEVDAALADARAREAEAPLADSDAVEALAEILWEHAQNPSGPGDRLHEADRSEADRYRAKARRVLATGRVSVDGVATDRDEQARAVMSAVDTIKATGGRVEIAGVVITPCDTYGTPLDFDAPPPQQWAIHAGWLIEPNGSDEPTPLVQLSTLDGYDSLAAELAPAAARRIAETLRALDEVGLRVSIKAAPDMEPERLEKFLDTMAENVERTLAEAKAKVTGGATP